jgi:hypothetical protein
MSEGPKRARFGLRFLLLIVALFAALFAWRHSVEHRHRVEIKRQRTELEYQLGIAEQYRDTLAKQAKDLPDNRTRQMFLRELGEAEARVSTIQKALDDRP